MHKIKHEMLTTTVNYDVKKIILDVKIQNSDDILTSKINYGVKK